MPSSGYGLEMLFSDDPIAERGQIARLMERLDIARSHGMEIEWLMSFVAAWNATHDVDTASWAGIEEWDM